jgi:hypothetical protein
MTMSARKWMAALALACSGPTMAQGNLGELLDMGAKQIQKDELVSLLSGLTMSGESFTNQGGTIRFGYKADGTVSGGLRTADGREFPSTGTWKVDDSGKFCREMIRANGARWGDCRYFFKLSDAYYAAETNDRGTKIEKRVFEKK